MKRILITGVGAVLALGATSSGAAGTNPSNVTVPAAGPKTVSASWDGTVPVGATTTFQDCSGNAASSYDSHKIHVTVAPGAYKLVKAKLTLSVASSPTLNGDFIELKDPSGDTYGVDQQKETMTVDVNNPVAGDWTALVCEFLPDSVPAHAYKATVTITTKCLAASPCPVAKPKPKPKR